MSKIQKVGVLGAGAMGSGIAEVCAKAGIATQVVEADQSACEAAMARIQKSLQRALEKGKLSEEEHKKSTDLLDYSTEMQSFAECDLVIEAIVESKEVKSQAFGELDEILSDDGILASNTSSVPISFLAAATNRPEKVVGMHFFNPVPLQPLVEVIPSLSTSEETLTAVEDFSSRVLGKNTIRAADRAGFLVNRLLIPYALLAVSALESGLASREDIDAGMRHGCAHPMGPLELCDFVGLDIVVSVADVLYAEFGETQYVVPPLLRRLVEAGHYGRKTGNGFYDYK